MIDIHKRTADEVKAEILTERKKLDSLYKEQTEVLNKLIHLSNELKGVVTHA